MSEPKPNPLIEEADRQAEAAKRSQPEAVEGWMNEVNGVRVRLHHNGSQAPSKGY